MQHASEHQRDRDGVNSRQSAPLSPSEIFSIFNTRRCLIGNTKTMQRTMNAAEDPKCRLMSSWADYHWKSSGRACFVGLSREVLQFSMLSVREPMTINTTAHATTFTHTHPY